MANKVPEKLIDFRVYRDGTDLLGVADVELPDVESMSETLSGAGLAGEVESPTVGQYKSMALKLKWRVLHKDITELLVNKAHHLDLRGSIQRFDAGSGEYANYALKVLVKGLNKKQGLGKLEKAKPQENETEIECIYLKIWLEGDEVLEIDKFNYVAKVNGEDQLADVRQHLGLEG